MVSVRMWVWSLASLSGLRNPALLCCDIRLAAAAPMQPLARELSYATGVAVKRKKFGMYFRINKYFQRYSFLFEGPLSNDTFNHVIMYALSSREVLSTVQALVAAIYKLYVVCSIITTQNYKNCMNCISRHFPSLVYIFYKDFFEKCMCFLDLLPVFHWTHTITLFAFILMYLTICPSILTSLFL